MKNLLRTIQGQLTPDAQTPGGTPSAGHQQAPTHNPPAADLDVRKFEKPRLPDVKVFDKGSHEEYTQWKIQIRTKLSADRLAYPTEFYQVHYVISRTEGWAFSALRSYITTINNGEKEPKLNELWSQLDGFFEDPAVKQKALQYLRTTRLAISQVTQFELTELTAKTQFSQSVLEAAGRQSSQFRSLQTD
ncbi:hypothetical protein PTTW11_05401 [Pyrenophora teres f. teres]|uniref:Uncharacterized protein n=1 Tax=Pyrenophora teres f. teres TaxID=97479 RepID=A0A6S6W1P2_9PLEO|nr:hypothetical protein PTTW11_05401 [Pyrenophora teres f. teres]